MKEEIYRWMNSLAVFYILFTMVLHLVPDGKYEKYVRFFMGLLLLLMMAAPVFFILGKGEELLESFDSFYQQESLTKEQEELQNLQEVYLEKSYQNEIAQRIRSSLKTREINPKEIEVNIEGESVSVLLVFEEAIDQTQERGIADGLMEAGIGEGEYQIKIMEHGSQTVADPSSAGNPSDGDCPSGIEE
jgi:stage III sporulation protein AF